MLLLSNIHEVRHERAITHVDTLNKSRKMVGSPCGFPINIMEIQPEETDCLEEARLNGYEQELVCRLLTCHIGKPVRKTNSGRKRVFKAYRWMDAVGHYKPLVFEVIEQKSVWAFDND